MTKSLAALLVFGFAGSASASLIQVPKGYEPVLDCAAAHGAPDFTVARKASGKKMKYYLAAEVAGETQMIELTITDGDEGYSSFKPKSSGDEEALIGIAEYITVNRDDEMDVPPITHGSISVDDRDDQECEVIGSPDFKI